MKLFIIRSGEPDTPPTRLRGETQGVLHVISPDLQTVPIQQRRQFSFVIKTETACSVVHSSPLEASTVFPNFNISSSRHSKTLTLVTDSRPNPDTVSTIHVVINLW